MAAARVTASICRGVGWMPTKTLTVQICALCVERREEIASGYSLASAREQLLPTGPVGCSYHLGVDLAGHAVGAGQLARSRQLRAEHVCLRAVSAKGSGQAGLNASSLP